MIPIHSLKFLKCLPRWKLEDQAETELNKIINQKLHNVLHLGIGEFHKSWTNVYQEFQFMKKFTLPSMQIHLGTQMLNNEMTSAAIRNQSVALPIFLFVLT